MNATGRGRREAVAERYAVHFLTVEWNIHSSRDSAASIDLWRGLSKDAAFPRRTYETRQGPWRFTVYPANGERHLHLPTVRKLKRSAKKGDIDAQIVLNDIAMQLIDAGMPVPELLREHVRLQARRRTGISPHRFDLRDLIILFLIRRLEAAPFGIFGFCGKRFATKHFL